MAFIAKTAFEARMTNNRNDKTANVAGKFGSFAEDAFTPADCSAGFLCVANGALPCEGFSGIYNENAYYMIAAPASVNGNNVIYACDTHDNQMLGNGNNNYYIGSETLGLGVPADRYGNFNRIVFNNVSQYRFGIGNVSGTLGENGFLTIADGLLVPAAAAPTGAGAIYFEVLRQGNFVEGAYDSFGYVDVRARINVAADA